MIINSIHAENVLKYSVLDLDEIPDRGLISVTGDNESGKSSIGESICFALFGRTFSLGPDEFDKVIRWGETRCSIRLDFTTPDGKRYQIARFLDKQGNHGASISLSGADPLVRGVGEVEERLRAIIGFGYTEFIESFYLAQREISTPNPHSFAVKAMAGVDKMEQAIVSCRAEQEGFREQLTEIEAEKVQVDAKIADLDLAEGHLETLEAEQQAISDHIDLAHQQIRTAGEHSQQAKQVGDRLVNGAKRWLGVRSGLSVADYRLQAQGLDKLLALVLPLCKDAPQTAEPAKDLVALGADARRALQEFDQLRDLARDYRVELQRELGEADDDVTETDAAEADATQAETPGQAADTQSLSGQLQALLQQDAELSANRRYWRLLLAVCLPAALALGGWSWWLGAFGSGAVAGAGSGAGGGDATLLQTWLPIGAVILGVFAASALWYMLRLSGRIDENHQQQALVHTKQNRIRERVGQFADLETIPVTEAIERLRRLGNDDIIAQTSRYADAAGQALFDHDEYEKRRRLFHDRVVALTDGLTRLRDDAATGISAHDQAIVTDTEKRQVLAQAIDKERERVGKFLELNAVADNLSERIADLDRRIRVRDLAIDLLEGAVHYISQRFNTEVRNLSADSLLKFTNGRYEHLQIDENLNVKAFSAEKRDFMHLDEISSGTQRQIMLAVRLSLSQKLVNSVIEGPQALFLDEPFAFFDEDRTASALAILPEVSGDFTQIWVTSQKFPERSHFDIHIECNARESVSPWIRRTSDSE
jgi:DNA repair exonuclease SbcCD ATPase subunit